MCSGRATAPPAPPLATLLADLHGQVMVADSLERPLSGYVINQLRQIYQRQIDRFGKLREMSIPCHRQPNSSDCGVFAAAFAFELACDAKDLDVTYDVQRMRQHLLESLETDTVQPLPHVITAKRGRKKQPLPLDI